MQNMNKQIKICIDRVCNFPKIYTTENLSPSDILNQCGYFELFANVTTNEISKYLISNVEIVDSWLLYSEDIRHSPAWGFGHSDNKWTVVLAKNGKVLEEYKYEDKIQACTKMIKMTVESIRLDNLK